MSSKETTKLLSKNETPNKFYTKKILEDRENILSKLDDYLNLLKFTQDNMFQKFTELEILDNNFYDFSNLNNHLLLCKHFSNSIKLSSLDEIYELWNSLFKKVITLNKDLRKYFITIPKKAAAFCLLEGRYYYAVNLLYDAVQLNPADFTVWFSLLWWTVFLDDWTLLGILLKREQIALEEITRSEGYATFIDCCRLVYSFHMHKSHCTDPHKIAIEIVEKLKDIYLNDKKTFFFSSCKALLRSTLVSASRLESANLEIIGDPLHNRSMEAEACELILQNRLPQFLNNGKESVSVSFIAKVTKLDEFSNAEELCIFNDLLLLLLYLVRICSSIVDYFESFQKCVDDFFDTGLVREAEGHSISLWKYSLLFGLSFRALSSLSFIFYIKLITAIDKNSLECYVDCINALITPDGSIDLINAPKKEEKFLLDDSSNIINLLSNQLNVCKLSSSSTSENSITSSNISALESSFYNIAIHRTSCKCTFCYLSCIENTTHWLYALKVIWIKLMLSKFDLVELDDFRKKSKLLEMHYSNEREKFWRSVTARTTCNYESFLSPIFSEHLINACVCFCLELGSKVLPFSVKLIQPSNDPYLEETLNLSKVSVLRFRSLILLINLLLRQSKFEKELELKHSTLKNQCAAHGNELTNQILYSIKKTLLVNQNDLPNVLKMCYCDQKNFGHLFFREWRQRNCLFLAQNLELLKWSWHKAMYFIEVATPSVRQCARMCSYAKIDSLIYTKTKKNSDDITNEKKNFYLPKFYFASSDELIQLIKCLAEDTTLINFALDDEGILWLIRCHSRHDPIVVPIINIIKEDSIILQMREILLQSDESVSKNNIDSTIFWTTRRKLDKNIQNLVEEWQERWFGDLIPLLLPLPYNSDSKKNRIVDILIKELINFGFSRQSSLTLIYFCVTLNKDLWLRLLKGLARVDCVLLSDLEENDFNTVSLLKILSFYDKAVNNLKINKLQDLKYYTLLVVPPKLNFLPWESLPIYKFAPLVSRIPSVHFFKHLLNRSKQIPKEVDVRNSFYVLNPSGDLENTQKRMTSVLEKFHWNGLIGKVPTRQEIQNVLAIHDIFLYLGHGSGGRYFGRSSIRESDCKAVSVLMGCSSVRILDEGLRFDGRGSVYEYFIAKCPCVVGCLWMVTDGEIDRFFMRLIDYCFDNVSIETKLISSINKTNKSQLKTPKLSNSSSNNTQFNLQTIKSLKNDSHAFLDDSIQTAKNNSKKNDTDKNNFNSYKLLIEGIVEARKACKLPYLTGCAVVCYGLPIISKSIELSIHSNNNS